MPNPHIQRPNKALQRNLILSSLLVAVTLAAYWPALCGEFFQFWDDAKWMRELEPLTGSFAGLWRIWTEPGAVEQYYPLTATSFWLDRWLWKDWTLPYHVENVLCHACSALLLGALMRRMRVPGAWLAAFIFALHPVMVESVAWVTERKNVLSLPLFLGALIASSGFASWRDEGGHGKWWRSYGLTFFLFLAAILAKITAFVFPAVILLLCWWKRGTFSAKRDGLPMLPFFAVTIALSLLVHHIETEVMVTQGGNTDLSLLDAVLVAGRALWFYVGKLLLPTDLCIIYEQWTPDPAVWWQWLFPIAALLAVACAWMLRGRIGRGPVTALLFFGGSLFPVLGFFEVVGMAFSFVADRWVYLSSLGLIVPVAAGLDWLARRVNSATARRGLLLAAPAFLGVLTWQSAMRFSDETALWTATTQSNPGCGLAFNNLGNIHDQKGRTDEAAVQFRKALELDPENTANLNNYANSLLSTGRAGEALEQFEKLLKLDPELAVAHYNQGGAYLQLGRGEEAIAAFREALRLQPDFLIAHRKLGSLLLTMDRTDEAKKQFLAILQLVPGDAAAHLLLGNLSLRSGTPHQALEHYEQALASSPANPVILNNVAWLLATTGEADLRNGPRALELASLAVKNAPERVPEYEQTLAFALSATGQHLEASRLAGEIATFAAKVGKAELARDLETQKEQFLKLAQPDGQ